MRYKRPESVLVIIYTRDGEVLMLERTRPAGFWQSVTGSLKQGEQAMAAAQRELFEETGLQAEPVATGIENRFPILPAWRDRYAPGVNENHEIVFTLALEQRCTVHLNEYEHSALRWLPREQAAALASSWTNREAILTLVPAT